MKRKVLGAFIGLSVVLSIDSLARVIIAVLENEEILMFSYSGYPGIIWPIVLVAVAGLSTFLGALFTLSYGKLHKITGLFIFIILLTLLRYSQTYLDRKSTRLNSSHVAISYAVFCLYKKKLT